MPRFIHRIRSIIVMTISPPSPSLLDAAFDGVNVDPATPTADHGTAPRGIARVDRLRPQRRDLSAALRSDADGSGRELAAWPPVAYPEPCRSC